MKKTFIYTAAIASMVLALASCEKEPSNINEPKDGMRLHVVSNDIQTKAQQTSTNRIVSETIDLSEGDVNLFFTAVEEDNLGNEFLMEPQTKGTIITTANFGTERATDFNLWLTQDGLTYSETGAPKTAEKIPAVLKGDYWNAMYTKGSEAYSNYAHWTTGKALDFWCWSGIDNNDVLNPDYTAGQSPRMYFKYEAKATAKDQSDVLFAYAGNQSEPSTKGDVDIHFFHALAAVQFCVGGLDEGVKITNIKLSGVKDSGKGTFIPSGSCINEGTDISKDKTSGDKDTFSGNVEDLFTWEDLGTTTTKEYSTGSISANNTSTATQYDPIGDEATSTFFFVPQDIKDIEIEISVTSSNGKQTNTLKKKIGLGSVNYDTMSAWKAGKIYRYTISGSGEVKVAVSEKLDGVDVVGGSTNEITKKENVSGLNNGTIKSYIRAAVVGNWYNEAGQIVAPFNSSSVLPASLANGWFSVKEGNDANCNVLFYYYENAVEPGAKTSTNLIESYTKANAGEAPIAGAHLELNIIMQAVDARDGKDAAAAAWGNVASKLK